MMQMFSHDLKGYDNWVVRCQDRESAKYHAELQKRADRQREALKAAKSLMTENSRQWMMSLIAVKDAAEGMLKVTEFLMKISRSHVFRAKPCSAGCLLPLIGQSAQMRIHTMPILNASGQEGRALRSTPNPPGMPSQTLRQKPTRREQGGW